MRTISLYLFFGLLYLFGCQSTQCQSYSIGHASRVFTDSSRSERSIPVEIYYPAQFPGDEVPLAAGAFPVLSLGHGFVMTISAYENFSKSLVPHGYILVLPNTETGTSPNHAALGLDLAFVIEQMKAEGMRIGSIFQGHIAQTSAVMGHSMGGGASFLAAAVSPTITAIVTFAAAITNPSSVTAATQISQPALIFAGSEDCVTPPLQHQVPMYDSLASNCKTYLSISGGGHCYFADYNLLCSIGENLCFPNLTVSREEQQEITFALMLPWLDCVLKGLPAACAEFQDSMLTSHRITYQQSCATLGLRYHQLPPLSCEVFPIPFRDKAMVVCEQSIQSLEVLDLFGSLLIQYRFNNDHGFKRFDTALLNPGVYLIRIQDRQGRQQVIRGIKVE